MNAVLNSLKKDVILVSVDVDDNEVFTEHVEVDSLPIFLTFVGYSNEMPDCTSLHFIKQDGIHSQESVMHLLKMIARHYPTRFESFNLVIRRGWMGLADIDYLYTRDGTFTTSAISDPDIFKQSLFTSGVVKKIVVSGETNSRDSKLSTLELIKQSGLKIVSIEDGSECSTVVTF